MPAQALLTSRLAPGCAFQGTPFPRRLRGRPDLIWRLGAGSFPLGLTPLPPPVERGLVLLRMCSRGANSKAGRTTRHLFANQKRSHYFSASTPPLTCTCFYGNPPAVYLRKHLPVFQES